MSDHPSERPEDEPSSMPPMPKWPEESGDDASETIPAKLQRAVWLMYAGAVLTLASIPLNLTDRAEMREGLRENTAGPKMTEDQINSFVDAVFGLTIFLGMIGAGLWVIMAILNKRGKNWARLTATVLGVLNIMYTLWMISGAVQTGASLITAPALVSMLTLAVAVVALVFLWNPGVRDWFDRQKNPTN